MENHEVQNCKYSILTLGFTAIWDQFIAKVPVQLQQICPTKN